MKIKRIVQAIIFTIALPFFGFILFSVGRYVFTGGGDEETPFRCVVAFVICFMAAGAISTIED